MVHGAGSDDNDTITIVPYELEKVEEEDEDQIMKRQQQQEEGEDEQEPRRQRVELGRPRTPKPTGSGLIYHWRTTRNCVDGHIRHSVIDQLESTVDVSSSLQAQHNMARSTIPPGRL